MTVIQSRNTPTLEEVRALKDEVKDLHPLLNILLPRLPGIVRSYYCQGNQELGADFILAKEEAALQKQTYVGVVVKVGGIRQDHKDVQRQIGECFVERKLPDGAEIQIREVWVLCSGEITGNARRVLAKEYADKKIEFVDSQLLSQWIDKFAPDSFVTTSPPLQQYSDKLYAQLQRDELNAVVAPGLESLYIQPDIGRVEFDHEGYTVSIKKGLSLESLVKAANSTDFAIVRAGAGGGKSKLMRELIRAHLASSNFSSGALIPLVAHARTLQGDVSNKLIEICREIRSECNAQNSRLAIFLDGFDEIDISDEERKGYIDSVRQIAGADGALSIWILSRPFDETQILGRRAQSIDVFQVAPLKGTKAIQLLTAAAKSSDIKHKLSEQLKGSALIRALDGAPIAYILLGRIIAETNQDLPASLTELFQKYCELFLGRWEIEKGLRVQKEYEVLMECLTWLGAYMLDHSLPEISEKEFAGHIDAYCKDRNIKICSSDLVEKVCQRSGILFKSGAGTVGFRHRAFAEYFYARGMLKNKSARDAGDAFDPYWVNSFFFYIGLLRDCPDLLDSLARMEMTDESRRLMRILQFGNFMMAAYMTPSSSITEGIKAIAADASRLYVEACEPGKHSGLGTYPTMQLLGIFSNLFRDHYGYAAFRESLCQAILEIDETWDLSEEAAVALFLLDTAYKDSGGDLKFDELIEKFGDSLPLVVKLAIGHEVGRMKVLSDKVKKMEKHLRKSARAAPGAHAFFKALYETPVNSLKNKLISKSQ